MDIKPYLIEISIKHVLTDIAIHDLVQKDSQFIIATHSPILLAYPNAKIIQLDDNGFGEVRYQDTERYNVTRDFLNKYKQMVDILTSD